jgi:hypothetical protein
MSTNTCTNKKRSGYWDVAAVFLAAGGLALYVWSQNRDTARFESAVQMSLESALLEQRDTMAQSSKQAAPQDADDQLRTAIQEIQADTETASADELTQQNWAVGAIVTAALCWGAASACLLAIRPTTGHRRTTAAEISIPTAQAGLS